MKTLFSIDNQMDKMFYSLVFEVLCGQLRLRKSRLSMY